MADNGDIPGSPSKTLAGLLLKSPSRPSQPPPSPIHATGPQLDLLFPATPAIAKPRPRPTPTGPTPTPTERRIWTVRDLVTGIRQQVEQEYQDLWVEGEISNCRPAPSGHIYFTLKDGEAQLSVVLFRREAQNLRFRPQDGLAVLARGRVSVYESRGQLQLIADTLEPRGAGLLQLAFDQLKARLLAEGLFDSARKRPLPPFPRCVGVITSTSGAVLHDIVKVIRRHARLNLLVYPAAVQGAECPASVIAGIRFFNRHPDRADLILLARGGGSIEDLAGFNDEALARAIAASALPIVSAIGHETDFTIADLVADLRAPTPSAAAEIITAAQHRIEERVLSLEARTQRAIRYQLILARQRLTALSVGQIHNRLSALIGRRAQRLDDLRRRLEHRNPAVRLGLARRRLERAEQSLSRLALAAMAARLARLNHAAARLQALSPLAVLSRGYALIYKLDGQKDVTLLRSAADTLPGQRIRARLASGSLTATIDTTDPQ